MLQGTENFSGIYANTRGTGRGGTIALLAKQLTLSGGAQIGSGIIGFSEEGGSISITVADTLTISGKPIKELPGFASGIFTNLVNQFGNGQVGNIEIEAGQIILTNGAQIGCGTYGAGNGGSISIKTDFLSISGLIEDDRPPKKYTGIFSNSNTANAGNAGNIDIEAPHIRLTDGGLIFSGTLGSGNSGEIVIKTYMLTMSGGMKPLASEVKDSDGNSNETPLTGDIPKSATGDRLFPSAISSSSFNQNKGNAGKIEVEARQIIMMDGGSIRSETDGFGSGGRIKVEVADTLTASGKYIGDELTYHSGI